MNTARLTASAQIVLSVVFLIGYFVMLWLFLLGEVRTPAEWQAQLGILLGVLTAGVTSVLAFWFARQRPESKPEPPNA